MLYIEYSLFQRLRFLTIFSSGLHIVERLFFVDIRKYECNVRINE